MPINDPVDRFHGERSAGPHHGTTCPLCGEEVKSDLPDHLPKCPKRGDI